MSKTTGYSRDNKLYTNGLIDYNYARLDQYVLTTSDVHFNNLNVANNTVVGNNLVVTGDFTVNGQTTMINTNVVDISDNIILINTGNIAVGVTVGGGLSGIEINRGNLPNFQFVYNENKASFEIGQIGNLQVVATREDTPLSYGIMIYNPTVFRLDSVTNITLPITFSSGINSTATGTGSVVVVGGIGVSQDITVGGKIRFFGTDYQNYIMSDSSDNLVINTTGNTIFQTTGSLQVPTSINLQFANNTNFINGVGTNLNLNTTTLNLNSTTVVLPNNTPMQWTTGNNMVFDGTNMNINATNKLNINAVINFTNTTASSSTTVGALTLAGGISINNTTDAANSSFGGTITTGGGVAIKKQLYVGNTINIGDVSITKTQVSGQGINLRSLNRAITTAGNSDTMFNTFEGGSINTSSSISNAHTLYITSPPTVSGGGSISNTYSLTVGSGNTKLAGNLILTDTTASTSSATGTVILSGSIAISNTTNSTSITSGGTFTSAGGMSISKDTYLGGKLDIGNLATTQTQVQGNGITFRSRSKTLTTVSNADITFNSFEGGIINSASSMTNASTVYISSSPTISGGGVVANSYSLYINSGVMYTTDFFVSTQTATNALTLSGGINTSNTTDSTSYTQGGTFTTAGGCSIAKTLYVGTGIYTNNGTSTIPGAMHHTLQNMGVTRFAFDLSGNESGSNTGSDLFINRYTDSGVLIDSCFTVSRSTASITNTSTIVSSSTTNGALLLSGGISINNTANALSNIYGGTLTSAGGGSFAKDFYVGGSVYISSNLSTTGVTALQQTGVSTNNGQFSVTGSNGVNINVAASSLIETTVGSLTLNSNAGSLLLQGNAGITLSSSGSINTTGVGSGSFTTTGGYTVTSVGLSLVSGTGAITQQTTGSFTVNSGTTSINCTDLTNGIHLATNTVNVPVSIGNFSNIALNGDVQISGDLLVSGSKTQINSTFITVDDIAIVVNNQPNGLSDGGLLIHRWQTPNNTMTGDLVTDTPYSTGIFQSGSTTPNTLVLQSNASAVSNFYNGWWIGITSGAGVNQIRRIKSYLGSTRTATLYQTSDNAGPTPGPEFSDGLDLVTAPVSGDTYSLFDLPYIGVYYSASNKEVRVAGVPFQQSTGTFGTPTTYVNMHVDSIIVQSGFTSNGTTSISGKLIVTDNDLDALLVQKIGSGGSVFTVDSINGGVIIANPVNSVNSNTFTNFNGNDSSSNVQTYSTITSSIKNNIPGSLSGALNFAVQNGGSTPQNMLTLNGTGNTVDFNTNLTSVKILNTGANSLLLYGSTLSNNTTDATASNAGGSFTILGGLGVDKKAFFGSQVNLTNTNKVTLNTVSGVEGNLNTNGDITLYNTSSQSIVFAGYGVSPPTFTSRSSGTKLVLSPKVSSSLVDYALGVNTASMWYSVPDSTFSHSFYTGITKNVDITSTGLTTVQANTGIHFYNGTNTASIVESSNVLNIIPHTSDPIQGVIFRDSSDTFNRIGINSDGQLSIGITGYSGTPSTLGNFLQVNSVTFTDAVTTASGLTQNMVFNSFAQGTLAATNSAVTTTSTSNVYIEGAPLRGTNQITTNVYGLCIDSVNVVNCVNAASLYIVAPPTGTITGESYSIRVDSGDSLFNGKLNITSGNTVSNTSNTFTQDGSVNVVGDIVLYNSTSQTIYFSGQGSGAPSYNTRSIGTKMVLNPNTGSSTVDKALGITSSSMWYSVDNTSNSHQFYLGTSNRFQIDNTGIQLDSNTTNGPVLLRLANTNKGIIINGDSSSGNTGAQLELYSNTNANTGNFIASSGSLGQIVFNTGLSSAVTITNTGQLNVNLTTDSTGTATGALNVLGGGSISKSLFIGKSMILNFNQPYIYTGDNTGALNINATTSGIASRIKYTTSDSNNTEDNVLEIYGASTEFVRIGFETTTTSYNIKTQGTTTRELHLETGSNTQQISLLTDGTVSFSSTEASSSSTTAAAKFNGGISINCTTNSVSNTNGGSFTSSGGGSFAKDLYIGGNINAASINSGISSPTITTINTANISGSITTVNQKLILNGNEATLSTIFRMTPINVNTPTVFEFNIPGMISNFANVYDITFTGNGYYQDSSPIPIENITGYCLTGTTHAIVQFTSGNIASTINTLMVVIRYTVY